MRKFILTCCFLIFASTAFGQQFLWTTLKDSSIRHVSTEDVVDKVLEFYDHYKFYYDGSGFTKKGFFEMFEKSQSFKNSDTSYWKDLKKRINEIDNLTVLAFKDNLGHGSVILVMCINKDNLNLISFSNNYETDAMLTYSTDREKFEKWFKSLLE